MPSNTEVSRKFTAAWNARDEAAITAALAEDCHFESARLPIAADGRDGVTHGVDYHRVKGRPDRGEELVPQVPHLSPTITSTGSYAESQPVRMRIPGQRFTLCPNVIRSDSSSWAEYCRHETSASNFRIEGGDHP